MAFPASIKTEQRASSQAVDVQAPSGSVPSPTPSTARLSGHALDPRPDLTDDHWYWVAVLAESWMQEHRGETVLIEPVGGYDADTAKRNDGPAAERRGPEQRNPERTSPTDPISSTGRSFYGLLHGLRCGGAELQKQRNRSGKKFLRLIYKPLLGPGAWQEDKLLKDWLQPAKNQMKACFESALETYKLWEELQAERAADKVTGRKTGQSFRDSENKTEKQVRSDLQTSSGPSQASLFRPA